MRKAIIWILCVYVLVTAGVGAQLLWIRIDPDVTPGTFFFSRGPATSILSLWSSIVLLWLVSGTALLMALLRKVTARNAVLLGCALAVSLLYIAILREHVEFGDYPEYIQAAEKIIAGQPFQPTYVYPPLWASFLAHVYRLAGRGGAIMVCFTLNHVSLVSFLVLAALFLSRCGLTLNVASLLVFLAMLVNVPVLRNVVYVQVNLLMADLLLAGVLLVPRSQLLAGFCLALGIHLKVFPLFLVPAFLHKRLVRLLVALTGTGGVLLLLIVLTDGFSYVRDAYTNVTSWPALAVHRSFTPYSFLVYTSRFFGTRLPVDLISGLVRTVGVVALYCASFVSMRKNVFARTGVQPQDQVLNGIIPLFFLMPVLSPTVWAHHLVIILVPTLVLLTRIEKVWQLVLFVCGYFFTFVMPVVDIYPWAYLRLCGWLILMCMTLHTVVSGRRAPWVSAVERYLAGGLSRALHAEQDVRA